MDAKNFSDVFTFAVTDKTQAPKPVLLHTPLPADIKDGWGKNESYSVGVGPYLHFRQHGAYKPSLWVTPAQWVVDDIAARMLLIENDSISFELIEFPEDGIYTLYAHYNLILGSRLICSITADSVPA